MWSEKIILAKNGNFIPNHKIRNFVIKLLWESFQFSKFMCCCLFEWLCFFGAKVFFLLSRYEWNECWNVSEQSRTLKLQHFHNSIHSFNLPYNIIRCYLSENIYLTAHVLWLSIAGWYVVKVAIRWQRYTSCQESGNYFELNVYRSYLCIPDRDTKW